LSRRTDTHTETPRRLFGITAGAGGAVTMAGTPAQEQTRRYLFRRITRRWA